MAKYNLTALVVVSACVTVEADSLEEAIELAKEREVVLEVVGSGARQAEVWILDDADGLPTDIAEACHGT